MKRVFVLSLVSLMLLLCVPLISCDSKDGLAAEEVAKIVDGVSTSGEPNSLSFDLNISADVKIEAGTQPLAMEIDANSIGAVIDNENKELYMPLTMSTSFFGTSEEQTAEIYIVNDDVEGQGWAYMYVKGEDDAEGSWTKAELTTEIWEQTQILPMEELVDILDMDLDLFDIEGETNTEKINGVECNILKLKPNMEKLAEYVSQQEDIGDVDISGLEDILNAFSVECKYWIGVDNHRVMKVSLVLKGNLSSDDLPAELGVEDFGSISVDISAEIIFDDYNSASIPELPTEAQSAEQGDVEIPFSLPFF